MNYTVDLFPRAAHVRSHFHPFDVYNNESLRVKRCWGELLKLSARLDYTIQQCIAEGGFGMVFQAQAHKNLYTTTIETKEAGIYREGEFVAIKIFTHGVEDAGDLSVINKKEAERECAILRKLSTIQQNEFVIQLVDTIVGGISSVPFALVFPLFTCSKYRSYCSCLTSQQLKAYMYGLFSALAFIHDIGIIHHDIQPANCLFRCETLEFKLIDFGLALSNFDPGYVQLPSATRYNRTTALTKGSKHVCDAGGTIGFKAPEVLLECGLQSSAVDVWSSGAIFVALLNKHTEWSWFGNWPTERKKRFKEFDTRKGIAELIAAFGVQKLIDAAEVFYYPYCETLKTPTYSFENVGLKEGSIMTIEKALSNRVTTLSSDYAYSLAAFELTKKCLELKPGFRLTAKSALQSSFFNSQI